jgi:V8-like Glu-specific endopeptidase
VRRLLLLLTLNAANGWAFAPETARADITLMKAAPGFVEQPSVELKGRSGPAVFTTSVSGPMGSTRIRVKLRGNGAARARWVVHARSGDKELATATFVGPAEGWTDELRVQMAQITVDLLSPVDEHFTVSVIAVASGITPVTSEGIIGTNDMRPYATAVDPIAKWGSPVARIRYMTPEGDEKACTGFMVAPDLLLTNQHCIADDLTLASAVCDFKYDKSGAAPDKYRGVRVVATDAALDFSVLELERSPGSKHGTLKLWGAPALDRALVTIHHPLGGPKMFTSTNCAATVLGVAGSGGSNVDFRHECDTQPGSSGSPLIDIGSAQVVGLHHLGCVDEVCATGTKLVNQGVPAEAILARVRELDPALATKLANATTSLAPESALVRRGLQPEGFEPGYLPGTFGPRAGLQEENDAFGLWKASDNYYTQGLRLEARWWADPRARIVRLPVKTTELWGVHLGQNIYTPTRISATDLDQLRLDRPYAGYLFGGAVLEVAMHGLPHLLSTQAEQARAMLVVSAELNVGTTGPSAAGGPVQSNWHGLLRDLSGSSLPAPPMGWGLYQTANRFSVDASVRGQLDVVRLSADLGGFTELFGSSLGLQIAARGRVDLGGLFDAVGTGLELRAGLLGGAPDTTAAPAFPLLLQVFGRADGRWVPWNGLISSPLLGGVVSSARAAAVVGEVTVGAVLRLWQLELAFAQVWRSSELNPVPPDGAALHNYGQINLSVVFDGMTGGRAPRAPPG